MFSTGSENLPRPLIQGRPENNYVEFSIKGRELGANAKTYFLSTTEPFGSYEERRRKEFTITKKQIKEINSQFPSTSQGPPIIHKSRNCLKISRKVLPTLLRAQLKSMDSDCSESIV